MDGSDESATESATPFATPQAVTTSSAVADPRGSDLGSDKPFFRIGEVAAILGVPAHVLRYWESEFALVRPRKSKNQQRVYRRQDVDNLLRIKHLLYER